MPLKITVPRLGWSMEEGVFAQWLKAPGDYVRAGEMVFVLEGDKAAHEVESFDSGYLCVPADAPQPGSSVKVGDVIGFLLAEGESAPISVRLAATMIAQPQLPATSRFATHSLSHPMATNVPASALPSAPRAAGPAARRLARELNIDLNAVSTPDPTGRILSEDIERATAQQSVLNPDRRSAQPRNAQHQTSHAIATPRARRRARELGIDWTCLAGSGRGGRIRERDILNQLTSLGESTSPQEPAPTESGRYIPATKLRLAIAQRMVMTHQAVPVTLTTKVDATALVSFREQLKREARDNFAPSFNDILVHWTAQTLRELPELNSCWYRDGIHAYDAIHIATAVDTPTGLLAPVIRDVDHKSLMEIAEQSRQLVSQARAGQLTQNQLTGGTFTISNLGMFGIDAFTPILNLPQAAILGIGRIVEEPVVRRGRVEVGQTLTLSLTFDHRVVDGAPAARWLQRLCQRLQS